MTQKSFYCLRKTTDDAQEGYFVNQRTKETCWQQSTKRREKGPSAGYYFMSLIEDCVFVNKTIFVGRYFCRRRGGYFTLKIGAVRLVLLSLMFLSLRIFQLL